MDELVSIQLYGDVLNFPTPNKVELDDWHNGDVPGAFSAYRKRTSAYPLMVCRLVFSAYLERERGTE